MESNNLSGKPLHYPDVDHPFFLYDPEDTGATFYATREERDAAMNATIAAYRFDGWNQEVTRVCAGEISHVAVNTGTRKRPEPCPTHPFHDDKGCAECTAWDEWPDHSYDVLTGYAPKEVRQINGAARIAGGAPVDTAALERVREFAKAWRWQRDRQQIAAVADGPETVCGLAIDDLEALLSSLGGAA